MVIVGGELTLEMLDLTFNPISKFHEAPLQMKANGGVFLVDDFGRQRMRPQDLLNRWIVPLESRVDYLTLHTGRKIQVPFDVLTVVRHEPRSGVARRRGVPAPDSLQDPDRGSDSRAVHAIFELNCQTAEPPIPSGDGGVSAAARHYEPNNRPLRSCHPRDLLDQVTALCRYRGQEPVITRELLDAACRAYFVDEEAPAPVDGAAPRRRGEQDRLEIH